MGNSKKSAFSSVSENSNLTVSDIVTASPDCFCAGGFHWWISFVDFIRGYRSWILLVELFVDGCGYLVMVTGAGLWMGEWTDGRMDK